LEKTVAYKTESDITAMLKDKYGIHKIPIASRMFGFVVNSYFVEKPCPTLVDVPPDEKVYLDKLQSGLGRVGYSINDVRRIIATHPHFDHFGAARTIAETSGAEIWVSEGGVRWFEDFEGEIHSEEKVRSALLFESGATNSEVQNVDEYYCRATPLARSIKPTRLLKEGDLFELSSLVFTVTTVPGHTPSCILLHDVEYGLGFSGDFLQAVTSNPIIQRNTKIMPSYNSLKSYIASLEKICATGLRLALPGHGEIIQDVSKTARTDPPRDRRKKKYDPQFSKRTLPNTCRNKSQTLSGPTAREII
jgi:glyoxylase-like metal-dependent hydrolase (beta-lactamase superfamily II)